MTSSDFFLLASAAVVLLLRGVFWKNKAEMHRGSVPDRLTAV